MPLRNWILLNSKNDMRFMLRDSLESLPSSFSKKKGKRILQKFEKFSLEIYDIIGVDLRVENSWTRYMKDFLSIRRNEVATGLRRVEGLEPLRIKTYKNTKLFYQYLDSLDNHFTDFEIIEFSFVENFAEKYCSHYQLEKVPDVVLTAVSEITAFYTFHRYSFEIKEISSDLIFREVMFSDSFVKLFIQKKVKKVKSISDFAKRLEKGYYLNKNSEQWTIDRRSLFDRKVMRFSPETDSNILEEIANVESSLGYSIDTLNTSVAEYYNKIRVVIEQAKRAEKENKTKPQQA